jgi:hypothetical protein
MILTRTSYEESGIYGTLQDDQGNQIAVTLEHSYQDGDNFVPKVASGTYTCSLHAPNRLPYTTYELQDVPDFQGNPVTGILLHIGNYNQDSDGCILLGQSRQGNMIINSKVTFDAFMASLNGIESFTLTIS